MPTHLPILLCVCVHACTHTCTHIHYSTHGGQRPASGAGPLPSTSFEAWSLFARDSPLSLPPILAQELWGYGCAWSAWLSMGSGDLNLHPHNCVASALPTKPHVHLPSRFFFFFDTFQNCKHQSLYSQTHQHPRHAVSQ